MEDWIPVDGIALVESRYLGKWDFERGGLLCIAEVAKTAVDDELSW